MEPGNKIAKEISSKEYFLQNSLVEYEQPNIYSLEEEFAKAKKNRDLKPYLVFFSFILLLILFTVLSADYLEDKSKQINIDISDFEDLRLKETLSAAKEQQQELTRKTEELDTTAKELDNQKGEIRKLRASFNREVQRIEAELQQQADLKNADKQALQRLKEKERQQLQQVKNNYEAQIAKKQLAILRLQEQLKNAENKLAELKAYQYGLSSFVKEKKAAGCIIDSRQRKNIIIFLAKEPKLNGEVIVDLYRGDNQYIGKVKLVPEENRLRCEMFETAKNQTYKPFDWFKMPE
jgi:DNA repair exonuclease SbcCD ATPase subunit